MLDCWGHVVWSSHRRNLLLGDRDCRSLWGSGRIDTWLVVKYTSCEGEESLIHGEYCCPGIWRHSWRTAGPHKTSLIIKDLKFDNDWRCDQRSGHNLSSREWYIHFGHTILECFKGLNNCLSSHRLISTPRRLTCDTEQSEGLSGVVWGYNANRRRAATVACGPPSGPYLKLQLTSYWTRYCARELCVFSQIRWKLFLFSHSEDE